MLVSDLELLRHILDETKFVLDTVSGKEKDEVMSNGILFRAVVRSIEIIGEATKKLSEDFRFRHPEIEWKKMGRTRDILIHVYFAIDNDIIWSIITEKLPPLMRYISQILVDHNGGFHK
jgi:uncharacterized protein with HEPN domain